MLVIFPGRLSSYNHLKLAQCVPKAFHEFAFKYWVLPPFVWYFLACRPRGTCWFISPLSCIMPFISYESVLGHSTKTSAVLKPSSLPGCKLNGLLYSLMYVSLGFFPSVFSLQSSWSLAPCTGADNKTFAMEAHRTPPKPDGLGSLLLIFTVSAELNPSAEFRWKVRGTSKFH